VNEYEFLAKETYLRARLADNRDAQKALLREKNELLVELYTLQKQWLEQRGENV